MDSLWILFVVLAIVLTVVAILSATIGYFWASSATKSALLKQLEDKGDTVYKRAQDQLQAWKEKELTSMQQQIYDAAKGQAIQEMQERVRTWQENELKQIKQQIQAGLHGDAIKEAQDQLLKWRNDDLENARRQIWEVLSKEANLNLEQWKAEAQKELREEVGDGSRAVMMGKMTEHIVPYLPGFGFNPGDARFVGSPIDLIVFDGLCDGDVKRVVFVEIKTGASTLSSKEKMIRDAVIARKVDWVEVKANTEGPDIVNKIKARKHTGSLIFEESEINSAVPPPTPNNK